MTGTDHTGKWTPQQYVLDSGWDFGCIRDTAVKGISEADSKILTDEQQAELLEYCKAKAFEDEIQSSALGECIKYQNALADYIRHGARINQRILDSKRKKKS